MEGRGGSGGRGGLSSADSGTTVELEGWSAILKAVQKSGDRGSNTTCKLAAAHRASQLAQTRGNIAASSGQARAALEKRGARSFFASLFFSRKTMLLFPKLFGNNGRKPSSHEGPE